MLAKLSLPPLLSLSNGQIAQNDDDEFQFKVH